MLLLKELSRYPIGTYADIIYRNALLNSSKEAFVYGDRRVTFAEFNRRVNSTIHALRSLGIKKGDGIGLVSWNCLDALDVYGAAMKGGFVVSPFNPRLKKRELDYLLRYSKVKVLFVGKELVDMATELKGAVPTLEHFVSLECHAEGMIPHEDILRENSEEPEIEVSEDDPFIIFYTSGTTGVPKGAFYSHYKKIEEGRTKLIHAGIGADDKHVMILPLFHIGGWSHFFAFFLIGAPNILMEQRSFDPLSTLETIEREKATDIHVVPTQLARLLEVKDIEKFDLSSLKRIWYAASPMPYELLRRGIERFGPIFAQGYGQSESGPDITILERSYHLMAATDETKRRLLTSCGKPCMWVHVRIVDEEGRDLEPYEIGEIIVQSKSVMLGYFAMPGETEETIVDGWLHTGDMGYYDEEGFLYIVDRKKDMIISGGENVYPREIEEVLYQHPAVFEACVIGVPDERWVERVHALIVPREGHRPDAEEITEFLRAHLAGYKVPKTIEFVDSLPKSPQGKILKRELKEKYWKKKES
jgi:acyl-CoA synthetase (AMP-forming)/AMP-acid ligase II